MTVLSKEIEALRELGFILSLSTGNGNMAVMSNKNHIHCQLLHESGNTTYKLHFNTHVFGHFEYNKLSSVGILEDKDSFRLALYRITTIKRAYSKISLNMLEVD